MNLVMFSSELYCFTHTIVVYFACLCLLFFRNVIFLFHALIPYCKRLIILHDISIQFNKVPKIKQSLIFIEPNYQWGCPRAAYTHPV